MSISIRALRFRGGPFLFGVRGRPVRKYRIKLYFRALCWGGGFGIIRVQSGKGGTKEDRGAEKIAKASQIRPFLLLWYLQCSETRTKFEKDGSEKFIATL